MCFYCHVVSENYIIKAYELLSHLFDFTINTNVM